LASTVNVYGIPADNPTTLIVVELDVPVKLPGEEEAVYPVAPVTVEQVTVAVVEEEEDTLTMEGTAIVVKMKGVCEELRLVQTVPALGKVLGAPVRILLALVLFQAPFE